MVYSSTHVTVLTRMKTILDELLDALEHLRCQQHDGGGAISNFGVLSHGDVYKGLCSRMDNIQQAHDGGTIITDRCSFAIKDELVHATRTERRSDGLGYGLACIDIRDDLSLSLRSVCPLLQEDDLGLKCVLHLGKLSSAKQEEGLFFFRSSNIFVGQLAGELVNFSLFIEIVSQLYPCMDQTAPSVANNLPKKKRKNIYWYI